MSEIEPSPEALEVARNLMQSSIGTVNEILSSGNYGIEWKPDNTPVTDIDKKVNQDAIEQISQAFPNDRIMGEEQSKDGSGNIWVIDPIDGTQALEQAIPAFTVCIARLDSNGTPQFSIVADPISGDIYESVTNQPTLKNGQPKHNPGINVSGCLTFLFYLVALSRICPIFSFFFTKSSHYLPIPL